MVGPVASHPGNAAVVERHGINHHRHQRPRLFRIPAPVFAPREVGPYRPHEDASGKACHGRIEQQKGELTVAASDDAVNGDDKCHEQQQIGHGNDGYMHAEQRRIEYWLHLAYPRIGVGHLGDEKPCATKHNGHTEQYGHGKHGALEACEPAFFALVAHDAAAAMDGLHAESCKEHEIADVGDGNAPWVVVDDEGGSHAVAVV